MKQKLRYEMFNFKDKAGLEKYKEMTSGQALSKCFEKTNCDTELSSKKWLKEYKNILQRCFKKIRITSSSELSELTQAIQNKSKLKEEIEEIFKLGSSCFCNENTVRKLTGMKIQLEECKEYICSLSASKNAE